MQFSELSIENLIAPAAFPCACGKVHKTPLKFVKIGAGAVNALPEALRVMGTKKPFVVCDPKTLRAAALYGEDSGKQLRKSHENPSLKKLYDEFLGEPCGHKSHELLHTHYEPKKKYR